MRTFLIGLACAVTLAVVSVVGLNLMDQSTADAFYTRYTAPPAEHEASPEAMR